MTKGPQRRDLSQIDSRAVSRAIHEFNKLGRTKFLRQYGFGRASKFYFLHEEKLYDTKPLISASYFHATGEKLAHNGLSGGRQTISAINNSIKSSSKFRGSRAFEDVLGELRNVSADFDRLAKLTWDVRDFGFSRWVQLQNYKDLQTGGLPGVYVISESAAKPLKLSIADRRVVYIGETVNQTLAKRLDQFNRSLQGGSGHSGGDTLNEDYRRKKLWLSIRSFPLRSDITPRKALAFRSSQIQLLEKLLLFQFVSSNGKYPSGNTARTGIRVAVQ